MRVVTPPSISFTCSCGAVNEGEPGEFTPLHTMPPSFVARCAFCHCESRVFPVALIARVVGDMLG